MSQESLELEEMQDFFDKRHDSYDEVHVGHISGGMEGKRVVAQHLPPGTRALLDLGVGTGLELEAVFRRFPDVAVTGIDISPGMLAELRRKYPGRAIQLRQEDYMAADLGNAAFDAAVSVMSLHHYTRAVKTGLYRRVYQALRPGGVYVESDYMLSEKEYPDPEAEEKRLFAECAQLLAGQGLAGEGRYHIDTPCTVANQINMLREAGFAAVREVWQQGSTVVLAAQKD